MSDQRRVLGARGEDRVAAWYRSRGYAIVERNWRCRDGEIDLIARRGSTVVVCEVKTRSSLAFGSPAEAVGPAKQRRLRRLAGRYLRGSPQRARHIRFDVASVLPGKVEVIEAVF